MSNKISDQMTRIADAYAALIRHGHHQPRWFNQAMPIELLQLHVRTYRALKAQQINTLDDLLNRTEAQLLTIPDITPEQLTEICTHLRKQLKLHLKSQPRSPQMV